MIEKSKNVSIETAGLVNSLEGNDKNGENEGLKRYQQPGDNKQHDEKHTPHM